MFLVSLIELQFVFFVFFLANLNTSDVFDDDSFFSESILISTQALEKEAITDLPSKEKKGLNETIMTPTSNHSNASFILGQPSPEVSKSISRRSFDLDIEDDQPILVQEPKKNMLSMYCFCIFTFCMYVFLIAIFF